MGAVDLARELGIKDSTLRRWAQEHGGTGENVFPGNGSPKDNKDYEIVKLRKKVEELERASLVEGAFDVEARNRLWAGDIACIGTGEGWPCLATVIDALHRKVVGWSMSGRMTEKPVADALGQAVGGESPPGDFSLVFHDDQGPSTLPGRSSAASSPIESPNPCRGRATHGTTRSRNPSSRRSSESWRAARAARRGRRRSRTCSNASSPAATGGGCAHRSAISPVRPRARRCLKKLIFRPRNGRQFISPGLAAPHVTLYSSS